MPTLQQIRTEIDTDPKSLGFATLKVRTDGPQAVTNKLNEVGASAETLFKSYVDTEDFLAEIVLAEFNALAAAGKTAVDFFFRGPRIKTGSTNMRATLSALFPTGATRTALIALASRSCSRAEALWGENVSVTATQVADALAI